MKTSWLIGIIMGYFLIMALEMMATGSTMFNTEVSGVSSGLMAPTMTNSAGGISALTTIVTRVADYFVIFGKALLLYSDAVFSGMGIWVWQFFCLPVAIGAWISIVTILRGVHAS